MSKEKAVLIAGGYGVVGQQVAELFRARNPNVRLLIGGRDKKKADTVAKDLGNAEGVVLDVLRRGAVTALADELSAVVPVVNDRKDYLLVESIQAKIPFVDITRWTAWQRESILRASFETIKSPVVFSSAWMAGVVALVSKKLTESFAEVNGIDIDVLFSLQDKAGPNSIEYVDQLSTPYIVYKNGEMTSAMPMTEPKMAKFAGGDEFKTYRFDTPDQTTLPITLGAKTVTARIGYDDKFTVSFLATLLRLGIWKILERPMFTKLRHSMLYNPGEGGPHKVTVQMTGTSHSGAKHKAEATIVDPAGQTHMTAMGTVIQIERVLGLNGTSGIPAGITFPEKHEDLDLALATLREGGVQVAFTS